ncbi:MAG: hypothetical protein JRG76_20290 [Deltaproteobacteria bacterium]|nr:hypothetical protein [Deltaproteobacteria bacterium]MBW2416843.1 hypothetical protein [Deltaproteobacteria bacterium]
MGRLIGALLCGLCLAPPAHAGRVWEVNGIRLEGEQVERLAADLADRTVVAVEQGVPDIGLRDEQRARMREIYLESALDVYERVVQVIGRDDLDDDAKQSRVRELVLEGQRSSHAKLEPVLDERQFRLYSAWETAQVESFQSRRLDARRRRRRR